MTNEKITHKKHTKSTNIAGALVIREDDLTMVTLPNGNIPVRNNFGYGIYYNDCRFLSGYVLKINGKHMTEILSSDQNNFESTTFLTNPDFVDRNGQFVNKETLSVNRNVIIPGSVVETITVNNFNVFAVALDLTLVLAADYDDIYTIRGITKKSYGQRKPNQFDGKTLFMSYIGRDRHTRNTKVEFSPAPGKFENGLCTFSLSLKPRGSCQHLC
jgi:glycogen debranching enzyme